MNDSETLVQLKEKARLGYSFNVAYILIHFPIHEQEEQLISNNFLKYHTIKTLINNKSEYLHVMQL